MIKLIENYSSATSWYRKYSDGFIEQGGVVSKTFSTDEQWTFTFPVAFTSAPLSISATFMAPRTSDSYGYEVGIKKGTVTATGVTFIGDSYGTNKTGYMWEAKGY